MIRMRARALSLPLTVAVPQELATHAQLLAPKDNRHPLCKVHLDTRG